MPVSGIAAASYCDGPCKRVAIYASFGMVARAFVWLWLGRSHDWNLRPARTTRSPPQVRISAARGQHRRALTLNFGGPFQASKMGGSFATEWCRSRYHFGITLGSLWDHFGIALGSLWDHFGITLGSLWYHFGITLGSLWDHFGITLGSLWDHFGITLGLLWDHFGITLGSRWDHFGIALGSLWDHFGITLGALWDHFGITLGSRWDHVGITLG